MDHGAMTMTTGGIQPTTTMAAMSAATSSSMGGMGGMGGGKCKISMLINYNTIGACFISDEWKITSTGMFAGSCIGVVVMSIFLEFLRRSVKEFDKYLVKQHISKHSTSVVSTAVDGKETQESKGDVVPPFRPNFWQQGIRAALHTAQFTVAYFIMLLGVSLFVIFLESQLTVIQAMYYNVYILVSIFIGILIGSYIFQYETLTIG